MIDRSRRGGQGEELLIADYLSVDEVHLNVSQAVVVTTADKIELCLARHLRRAEQRKAWVAPLSLVIAVGTSLGTSTFQDIVFSAEVWRTLFVLAGIGGLLWLGVSVWQAREAITVQQLIKEIQGHASHEATGIRSGRHEK